MSRGISASRERGDDALMNIVLLFFLFLLLGANVVYVPRDIKPGEGVHGIVYLHPSDIVSSWYGRVAGLPDDPDFHRDYFWSKDITSLKQQIKAELDSLKEKGFNYLVTFVVPRENAQVEANIEWLSLEGAYWRSMKVMVVVASPNRYYEKGEEDYGACLDLLSRLANLTTVDYVSSYSKTLNATEFMNWYENLPIHIKDKFIVHVDEPFIVAYQSIYSLGYPTGRPVLLEVYTEKGVYHSSSFNEAFFCTGIQNSSMTPENQRDLIRRRIWKVVSSTDKRRHPLIWCFDDANDGSNEYYSIHRNGSILNFWYDDSEFRFSEQTPRTRNQFTPQEVVGMILPPVTPELVLILVGSASIIAIAVYVARVKRKSINVVGAS